MGKLAFGVHVAKKVAGGVGRWRKETQCTEGIVILSSMCWCAVDKASSREGIYVRCVDDFKGLNRSCEEGFVQETNEVRPWKFKLDLKVTDIHTEDIPMMRPILSVMPKSFVRCSSRSRATIRIPPA